MSRRSDYKPAVGRQLFTSLYDPMMALTMPEGSWRPALVAAVVDPCLRLRLETAVLRDELASSGCRADHGLVVANAVLARDSHECGVFRSHKGELSLATRLGAGVGSH